MFTEQEPPMDILRESGSAPLPVGAVEWVVIRQLDCLLEGTI